MKKVAKVIGFAFPLWLSLWTMGFSMILWAWISSAILKEPQEIVEKSMFVLSVYKPQQYYALFGIMLLIGMLGVFIPVFCSKKGK